MNMTLFSPFAEVVEFNEAKTRAALNFTEDQILFLRNKLVSNVAAKLSIAGDAEEIKNAEAFVRAHEFFRGRIEVLQELLNEIQDMQAVIENEVEQSRINFPE